MITLKNAVFPAPLGPMEAHDRPLGDREVDVVDRDQATELLAQRLDFEQAAGLSLGLPSGAWRTSISGSS